MINSPSLINLLGGTPDESANGLPGGGCPGLQTAEASTAAGAPPVVDVLIERATLMLSLVYHEPVPLDRHRVGVRPCNSPQSLPDRRRMLCQMRARTNVSLTGSMKQVPQVRCWFMRSCERQQHGRIIRVAQVALLPSTGRRSFTVAIRMSGLIALRAICCRLA